jgi:hypothetical protein
VLRELQGAAAAVTDGEVGLLIEERTFGALLDSRLSALSLILSTR